MFGKPELTQMLQEQNGCKNCFQDQQGKYTKI